MAGEWEGNWGWGLSLIAVTLAMHALGVVLIAFWLERVRTWVLRRRRMLARDILTGTLVIVAVGLLLAILHGIEAIMWATAFLWLGAVESGREAILFSLDSLTTRGASGLQLNGHWQLMGAIEAAAGVLVFGISTAFVFTVLQRILPVLGLHAHEDLEAP